MNLSGMLSLIRDLPAYRELLGEIERGQAEGSLALLRAARPYLVAALAQDLQRPILFVVARPEQVTSVADQLKTWLRRAGTAVLPLCRTGSAALRAHPLVGGHGARAAWRALCLVDGWRGLAHARPAAMILRRWSSLRRTR